MAAQKELKEKIDRLIEKTGKSKSQIFRDAWLNSDKLVSDAYDKGHNDGINEASNRWGIWYFCSVCGEMIFIESESDSHKAVIKYMKEHGWAHGECCK